MEPIRVLHFSDVLCVWSYVAQQRVDELRQKLGDQVSVDVRFCSVFGDARRKIEARWKDKGGLSGYGASVRDVAEELGYEVHPNVFRKVIPSSSLACHLFLCAVRSLEHEQQVAHDAFLAACWAMRTAYFRDLRDIATRAVQRELAEEIGLPVARVEAAIDSGQAHAELSADYELAREHTVTVSPTLILNEGRQRLNGNVSFRVIEANVTELIRQRELQSSTV